jgi:Uma2 family endonuclease
MAALAKVRITVEEYLALDARLDYRLEYINGEIVAMAGASRAHNLINYNLTTEFGMQLRRKPCEAYASEMRVHIPATGDYAYPDQVVVCTDTRDPAAVLFIPAIDCSLPLAEIYAKVTFSA